MCLNAYFGFNGILRFIRSPILIITRLCFSKSSGLRLAVAVGPRKVLLLRWRHPEEWYSLTTETAEGFELKAALQLPHGGADEQVRSLTILGNRERRRRRRRGWWRMDMVRKTRKEWLFLGFFLNKKSVNWENV